MRSPREIAFRLRQEAANAAMLLRPPRCATTPPAPLPGLPDPAAAAASVRGSAYARDVERLAESILAHRFPLLGFEIETGPAIDWRRDYRSGRSTGLAYFRRVPYLDFARAGDHKNIWELNRHQHLVLLAQAWRLTGREDFLAEIAAQLESWLDSNPFGRGINWASALEVAFRALSWLWVWHLAGERLSPALRRRLAGALYAHGRHLEHNLSVYFSPNTHLLGEAVALHTLGVLFPGFPRADAWRRRGGELVRAQMQAQTRPDGSHFESSTYYHVYALDMLLFSAVLEKMPAAYRDGLARMADYLDALIGPDRRLDFAGDDDGGRFFHPYGPRDGFGRGSLAVCAQLLNTGRWAFTPEDAAEMAVWWLGPGVPLAAAPQPASSTLFPDAGVAVMNSAAAHIVVDAGPFGEGSGGHSHSDTLAVLARSGGEEILVDAGTFTYVADPAARDWFRGSAAHNTVRIDGLNQGDPSGPFRWATRPRAAVLEWRSSAEEDYFDGLCAARGCRHRRRLLFRKPGWLFILDEIDGPAGEHLLEQFWHAGEPVTALSTRAFRIGSRARLLLSEPADCSEGGEHGWRSPAFGVRIAAPVVRAAVRAALPASLGAALDFSGSADAGSVELVRDAGAIRLSVAGAPGGPAVFESCYDCSSPSSR